MSQLQCDSHLSIKAMHARPSHATADAGGAELPPHISRPHMNADAVEHQIPSHRPEAEAPEPLGRRQIPHAGLDKHRKKES
jgi:hypothetical protein